MPAATLPYGDWPSAWTAQRAAEASRDFAELCAGHGGLYWIDYCPSDSRCTLWHWRSDAAARCVTPRGFSVRSRVYEYGGGAFCLLPHQLAFVNEADQQIWLQPVDDAAAPPRPLTSAAERRYGDLQYDPLAEAILAIEESHEAGVVRHRLVSIAVAGGARQVVAEDTDFYSAPTLSPDGQRLAWVEWDRPHQPWSRSRLQLAQRSDGRWCAPRCLAGANCVESVQQPRFSADGVLHWLSDHAGWWQPWCETERGARQLIEAPYDHAPAPWQLATRSYLPLGHGQLLLTRQVEGFGLLLEADGAGTQRRLAEGFSRCRQLAADAERFYCIAGSPTRLPAVLAIERRDGTVRVLAGGASPLADEDVSRPEPLAFATANGETAHAFFFAPRNPRCAAPSGTRPPLVIFVHGGPTSACYPVFDPRIQFWTQRGFAVADLNYRGSTGFGRAYRQRLHLSWGITDVEDALALVEALSIQQRVDPQRVFIRGSSAGGYTALSALAASSRFRGGASLYGVSDPRVLRRVTHKFEGDYLDWLIGDPEQLPERYRARSPLHRAGDIRSPVIFFQGGLDAVVLPEQTERMVAALQAQGVEVEYRRYPGERHGFRDAANLADALEREWRFYLRLLA